jgi:hypothetical protein
MKKIIYIIAFIPFISVCGQKNMPGGVRGATVWEVTEVVKDGQSQFVPQSRDISNAGFNVRGKAIMINNNPALYLPGKSNNPDHTLDLGKLKSFSLFTICQETDTTDEKIIFSLENDSAAEMILTNRRLAALDIYRYAGFSSDLKLYPKIYSYTQNRSSDTGIVARRLQLGQPPQNQHFPVSGFNGVIPEVILFSRVISPMERQKVESYLAIKYGISLNQEFPASYLNSSGEIIWDAEINEAFNRNIAGIGRDDLSDLNQVTSENTRTPGVMKIGVQGVLKNNKFMIWGDNGKPLRFNEEPGIRRLQREWKISAFNSSRDTAFLETDIMSLSEINPLIDGEVFWLMVDRSGTGKFPFRQTEYFQSLPFTDSGKIIKFNHVVIDADNSGNDIFTILSAPQFFTRSILLSPSCHVTRSGVIQTEIIGGEPPFVIVLTGISDSRIQLSSTEARRDHIFEGISQGEYILNATDSKGKSFAEKIFVSNSVPWDNLIGKSYSIPEDEAILLNASEGMPAMSFSYIWTTPEGLNVKSEALTISQPGVYLLSVTDDNNCNVTREINVRQSGRSVFKMVDLYPNPVRGWFTLRISLERLIDVNIIITDLNGRILKQTLLKNDQFYRYSDIISQSGSYFITLLSGNEKVTMKLIVQ